MAKRAVIFIFAVAIILQNTCLMGAAGRSVVFRALHKGCPMCCLSGCYASRSCCGDGLKICSICMKGNDIRVICHYQLEIGDIAAVAFGSPARQAYLAVECRLKFIFLDPPLKPPSAAYYC